MKKYFLLIAPLVLLVFTQCKNEDESSSETVNEVELVMTPNLLTIVNILRPETSDENNVLTLLSQGIDETVSKQSGFISSSLHRSLDNDYIINYARWRSGEDLQATVDLINSGGIPKMAEAFSLGNPDFHPFQVTAQFKSSNTRVLLDTEGQILTIINILQPLEGVTQAQLAHLLKNGIEQDVLPQEGFISSTIHESLDNDYVINYAQWESEAALNAFVEKLQSGNAPAMGEAFSSASVDFHPYTITNSYFKN